MEGPGTTEVLADGLVVSRAACATLGGSWLQTKGEETVRELIDSLLAERPYPEEAPPPPRPRPVPARRATWAWFDAGAVPVSPQVEWIQSFPREESVVRCIMLKPRRSDYDSWRAALGRAPRSSRDGPPHPPSRRSQVGDVAPDFETGLARREKAKLSNCPGHGPWSSSSCAVTPDTSAPSATRQVGVERFISKARNSRTQG